MFRLDGGQRRLHGFEALVRWQHPVRGLVAPRDFLPIAESTGLIVALGERVLRDACRQAANWQRLGGGPIRVAVNVTARQFRSSDFLNTVKYALSSAKLDAQLLELEIIENTLMERGVDTDATFEALRIMGVQLSIDDFGTGYSSLSYLKHLPIDAVKIDQSFVADLPDDADAGAIVGAIIALAHNLGLQVLAEGVETKAQFDYLREHGCNNAQGFFIGHPKPAESMRIAVDEAFVATVREATTR
jgi:EAL domain-containing protein (putative c-di-GMP-specific phosphodiesterase class I)